MNRILTLSLLVTLLVTMGVASLATAAIDADRVNEATVLLKAAHRGVAGETGSGVVVCVKDGHAYILTAKHVLESEPGKRARGLTLTVSYFQGRWPAVTSTDQRFEYKWAQTKDLALIKVKLDGEGPRPITIGDSRQIAVGADIATTGHPVDLQTEWVFRKGDLSKKGEFLEYGASVGKGYSGGPLVDGNGDLVGVNVQIKQGTQGASLAAAIPVNEVLTTIENWLDTACLDRSTGPGTPGGPTVAGDADVEELADEYWSARDRDEMRGSWYADWYQRMHAAIETDTEFDRNDLRAFQQGSQAITTAGSDRSGELAEYELESVDDTLDNLGLGVMDASTDWSNQGTAGMPGAVVSVDYFILTAYSEPGVGTYVPPQITGQMTSTEMTGGFYRVEMAVQMLGMNYVTVFDGTIQGGTLFTGSVVNSNVWAVGTTVVLNLAFDGYTLTVSLPDGTVYQWAQN